MPTEDEPAAVSVPSFFSGRKKSGAGIPALHCRAGSLIPPSFGHPITFKAGSGDPALQPEAEAYFQLRIRLVK